VAAAEALTAAGVSNVAVLQGGSDAWKAGARTLGVPAVGSAAVIRECCHVLCKSSELRCGPPKHVACQQPHTKRLTCLGFLAFFASSPPGRWG